MKSILFILPSRPLKPSGGFKVAFEYANRLADHYSVGLLYPLFLRHSKGNLRPLLGAVRRLRHIGPEQCDWGWFPIDPRISQRTVFSLSPSQIPDADVYVATAVETAIALHKCPKAAGKTIYLIQDFENWAEGDQIILDSYRFGFRNVVISRWLEKKVAEAGNSCTRIPNGFDFDKFRLSVPPEQRNPHSVAMQYRPNSAKGLKYGIAALEAVRRRVPDLKATLFSTFPRPADLPEWIDFECNPSQRRIVEIYNEAAVYAAPSLMEGWGLPVGEAMICGAAVACTDTAGFLEMAVDGRNALISPAADADAMAANILRLISDTELRRRLAQNAAADIRRFSWPDSAARFKQIADSLAQ